MFYVITYFHLERFGIAREGMRSMSNGVASLVSVGDSESAAEFVHALPGLAVDILLLDMDLDYDQPNPLSCCLELCELLFAQRPELGIVFHSPYRHAGWMAKFIKLGVKGFVSKNSGFKELIDAFKAVKQGQIFICPVIANQFSNYQEFCSNPKVPLKLIIPGFSAREAAVLDLLIKGYTTKAIAEKLFISIKTVETHRRNLLEKAQVKNSVELVRFVSVQGLLMP